MPDVRLSPTRPLALALFLLAASRATAQDIPKNSIYFELGGTGLFYTLNYERTLFEDVYFERVNARIGFGKLSDYSVQLTSVPVMLHLLKNARHGPDLGAGILFFSDKENWLGMDDRRLFALALGYRYQSPGGRVRFQVQRHALPFVRACLSLNRHQPRRRLLTSVLLVLLCRTSV